MVVIGGNIWCGTANTIKILNPATKEVEDVVTVGQEESKVSTRYLDIISTLLSVISTLSTQVILAMAECGGGAGVWVAQQGSASVKLLHATTFITLTEVQIDIVTHS